MKSLPSLLRQLSRPGVTELALGTGRPPCVKHEGAYKPVGPETLSTEDLLQMATAAGAPGALGEKPTQWAATVEGIAVDIVAVRRGAAVQVKIALARGTPTAPASASASAPASASASAPATPTPTPTATATATATGPVPRDLDGLLAETRRLRASDLHLVSERPPLFRLAGELTPRGEPMSPQAVEALVQKIVPQRLQSQLAKDGSADFALAHPASGRFRVNVSRQRTGLKICMRAIAAEVPTLASLGLPEEIGNATHHHQGLIVITGPTGHGKTSTLAALVDLINRDTTHHVITVEDPIEYVHPRKKAMLSQREVHSHTKSFAAALKGSLRQDPEVIVVGELRDLETVRMAISAAETGHLVIGTMNTQSAAKTIDRLIDLFPPGDQQQVRMFLAGGLRLVVSQRLLANAEGTGVVAAAEVLPGMVGLWNLIREAKTYQIPSLQQRGKGLGVTRLDDSLAELVKAGRTSLEQAKRYAESPEEVEAMVTGKRPAAGAAKKP